LIWRFQASVNQKVKPTATEQRYQTKLGFCYTQENARSEAAPESNDIAYGESP
jgi:hypothetical protein